MMTESEGFMTLRMSRLFARDGEDIAFNCEQFAKTWAAKHLLPAQPLATAATATTGQINVKAKGKVVMTKFPKEVKADSSSNTTTEFYRYIYELYVSLASNASRIDDSLVQVWMNRHSSTRAGTTRA